MLVCRLGYWSHYASIAATTSKGPDCCGLALLQKRTAALTHGNTDQTLANLLQPVNPVLRGWPSRTES